MSDGAFSMLRRLGAGSVRFDVSTADASLGTRAAGADGSGDFGLLMEHALRGELRSDLPVRVPPELKGQIDPGLLALIAEATDLAASDGIRRALVLSGERTFRVDVGTRSVIDAPVAQQSAVGDIDGMVRVPPASTGSPASAGPLLADGPARVVRSVSLLRVLADRPANLE